MKNKRKFFGSIENNRIFAALKVQQATRRFPGIYYENYMRVKTTINDFRFEIAGFGRYKVTYQSPVTGKKWENVTNDMMLIDATKNADKPMRRDLIILKRICKDGRVCR